MITSVAAIASTPLTESPAGARCWRLQKLGEASENTQERDQQKGESWVGAEQRMPAMRTVWQWRSRISQKISGPKLLSPPLEGSGWGGGHSDNADHPGPPLKGRGRRSERPVDATSSHDAPRRLPGRAALRASPICRLAGAAGRMRQPPSTSLRCGARRKISGSSDEITMIDRQAPSRE